MKLNEIDFLMAIHKSINQIEEAKKKYGIDDVLDLAFWSNGTITINYVDGLTLDRDPDGHWTKREVTPFDFL